MEPCIGQNVQFIDWNGQVHAAIITGIPYSGGVNLTVFNDPGEYDEIVPILVRYTYVKRATSENDNFSWRPLPTT